MAAKKATETRESEAYCMKCRTKRTFTGDVVELKNGAPAIKGPCPECGTTMVRILPREKKV